LKERVAHDEGGKDEAHLLIREAERRHHLARRHGNVDAIDVGDDADAEE
jgi:hypothetical protein